MDTESNRKEYEQGLFKDICFSKYYSTEIYNNLHTAARCLMLWLREGENL